MHGMKNQATKFCSSHCDRVQSINRTGAGSGQGGPCLHNTRSRCRKNCRGLSVSAYRVLDDDATDVGCLTRATILYARTHAHHMHAGHALVLLLVSPTRNFAWSSSLGLVS